jgi:hypothetical protein
MKKRFSTFLLFLLVVFGATAQNTNITNLMSQADWNSIFPQANSLYTYNQFKTAINEMADYSVSIRKKSGIAGQLTTVTRKGTGATYNVTSVSAAWYGHAGQETTIDVDFADFINRADQTDNKRELAAFLANVTKETTGGWYPSGTTPELGNHNRWGLYFTEEQGSPGNYISYTDPNYPPTSGQSYKGRGPIQLSWNYNYGQASHFLFDDKSVLLNNPGSVATDGVLTWKTAIWFWMSPQCPKPSCHQVMHNVWVTTAGQYPSSAHSKMYKKGFAHTNNIINGGLECRTSSSLAFQNKVALRSELYKAYLADLGLTPSQITLEYTGNYTTTCYDNTSAAMTNYADCSVEDNNNNTCTTPSLGGDNTICASSLSLNAGVSLGSGETIKWFKDGNEISGQTTTSLSVTTAGLYKAIIYSSGCVRSDEVTISQGGTIQVSAANGGNFCTTSGPTDVEVTVNGGGGFYKLYDAQTGGNEIASGASFTLDNSNVASGNSETFYVEEPAGQTVTLGLSSRPADDPDFLAYQWSNQSVSYSYNSFRTIFTADTDITFESVDVETANIGNGSPASLTIEVYEFGGLTLVDSKTFDLQSTTWSLWDQALFTADLGFNLPAGQYELSVTPSNIMIWLCQYNTNTKNFDYANWKEDGVVSLDATIDPINRNWGTYTYINHGTYNWKFSTNGGGGSNCGRVPVVITHDCTIGSDEINSESVNVFPNPASNFVNITFNNFEVSTGIVEIFNSVGQSVLTQKLNVLSGNVAQINTKDLETGLYFVKVSTNNKVYSSNVVISK